MRLQIYRDTSKRYRWRAKAGNNRVVGASEQGYRFRWYATRKAKRAYPEAEVIYVVVEET